MTKCEQVRRKLKNWLNGLRLKPFRLDDYFLRRVSRRKDIRDGIISSEAFLDKHPTLSFTLRRDALIADEGLIQFQLAKRLPHGDLPGIIAVSFNDLTVLLDPPLRPWLEMDFDDPIYGYLHCNTEAPHDAEYRDKLAKLASKHGVLRDFVDRKRAVGTQ